MDSVVSPRLPIQTGIPGNSACLQIEVFSGARRNPHSNFESTVIFLGSDPECDFILSEDSFPPMYAFLLIDSRGVVLRHLGGGPVLLLDAKPIGRQRITTTATVSAGPLTMALQITPSAIKTDRCQNANRYQDIVPFNPSDSMLAAEAGIQLIEQASRLLASISSRGTEDFAQTTAGKFASTRPTNLCTTNSADLKLSVGLPVTGQLPPIWQHICLN